MPIVSFTRMDRGTSADFELIERNDAATAREVPDRVLAHLRLLAGDDGAYPIDRLQHSLQTATRIERDGADEQWVVAALLHDIGDVLAPHAHGEVAAEILKPFVREDVEWVVRHHGAFQRYYYANLPAEERNVRERFAGHRWFDAAADFCARFDQCSFDPGYDTLPLEHFEPVLRRVFARGEDRA